MTNQEFNKKQHRKPLTVLRSYGLTVLKLAFRNSFRANGSNLVKILSLWIGLTISLVLIAKIVFELSFDRHYPDSERIYQVWSNYSMEGSEMKSFWQTSGAIAWGMKNDIPEVENATRFTFIWNTGIYTEDKRFLLGEAILADDNLFDIFYRPMIIGNAKEILNTPMHCLVSKTLAEKIGMENIVGKTITLASNQLTIGGVFEDFPENSTIIYDVIVPLKSISIFTWDGSENWVGNDRYAGYVKLRQGVRPESLAPQMAAMLDRNVDKAFLEEYGVRIEHFLVKITSIHKDESGVKQLLLVFGLLVAILLVTSILNYILTVISSLVNRTKEIAVHKSYGASRINISQLLFAESFIHLIASLVLSAITILLFEDIIVNLLQTSLHALFAPQILFILAGICVIILLVTGFLPAYLFSKIPVTAAFQRAKENHRRWKTVLIFLEVVASTFIISILMIVAVQYHKLISADQGYSYKNLLFVDATIRNPETRRQIVQELIKIPEINDVALCERVPIEGASGNNISEIGCNKQLFNIADMYNVDENYLAVMEIPIVAGRNFIKGEGEKNVMMVSELFVDKMVEFAGWTDGVVGKSVFVSEHGEQTICGVFGNIVINPSLFGSDERPAVIFYDPDEEDCGTFLIKMHTITPQIVEKIFNIFDSIIPNSNISVENYEEHFKNQFSLLKILRLGMLICSIVTLFIALIGLIGYFHVETNRRRSEIAIRKINGATTNSIQGLFLNNILKVIIPAILVGITGSIIVAKILQKNFADKVHISLFLYLLCAVGVASVILAVISLNIYKAAARNPVENLE